MHKPKRAKPRASAKRKPVVDFANFDPPPATVDEVTEFISGVQRLDSRAAMGERFAGVTAASPMPKLDEVIREIDKAGETDWLVDLIIETAETFQRRTSMIYAAMAKLEVICTKIEKERANA